MTEFAMNNAVHASTGFSPFFVNNARHPRSPVLLGLSDSSTLGGGGTPDELASTEGAPTPTSPPCDGGDTTDGMASTEDTAATTSPCDHGDPTTVSVTEELESTASETALNTARTRSVTRNNHRPLDVDDTTRWVTESLINPKRRSDHFIRLNRSQTRRRRAIDLLTQRPSKRFPNNFSLSRDSCVTLLSTLSINRWRPLTSAVAPITGILLLETRYYYRQQAFKTHLPPTLEETNLRQGLLSHSR